MPTIKLNSLVRRQTPQSEFSHFEGTEDELLAAVQFALSHHKCQQGYRAGVLLANVYPRRFFTGIVVLQEYDRLVGAFESRQPRETPRKTLRLAVNPALSTKSRKTRAKSAQVVLYSHDTLAEDGDAETDADFEIVAINAVPTDEPAPIAPDTLMHNHFGSDGGTATGMSPVEFEEALRESFTYWKDKAMVEAAPANSE
jgi:hypothetical protein